MPGYGISSSIQTGLVYSLKPRIRKRVTLTEMNKLFIVETGYCITISRFSFATSLNFCYYYHTETEELLMPKFRIYVPVRADEIYEVECESKEAAEKMWEEGLNFEHFVGTTESYDYSDVKGIVVEEQS